MPGLVASCLGQLGRSDGQPRKCRRAQCANIELPECNPSSPRQTTRPSVQRFPVPTLHAFAGRRDRACLGPAPGSHRPDNAPLVCTSTHAHGYTRPRPLPPLPCPHPVAVTLHARQRYKYLVHHHHRHGRNSTWAPPQRSSSAPPGRYLRRAHTCRRWPGHSFLSRPRASWARLCRLSAKQRPPFPLILLHVRETRASHTICRREGSTGGPSDICTLQLSYFYALYGTG